MRERVTTLTSGRIRFEDARIEGKRIAIGPLSYRARRYSAPRVLLAGDAAHFLDPFTGQGVYLALRSAQLASRAVIRTLAEDIPEPRAWREYERQLRHEIARRRRLSAIVALLVRVPAIAKNAAALLERKPDAFRPLLDAVTR
jgi:flavin-dependent dehydrogenase